MDFESQAGRPQTRLVGGEMSLQEKSRVMRQAVSLLGRAAGQESVLPAGFTNRCRSLVPLGAGTTAGVKGRPIFTRPAAVWHHLRRLQQYSATQWARQQQARVTRQQHKRRRARGHSRLRQESHKHGKRDAWAKEERSVWPGHTRAIFMRAR